MSSSTGKTYIVVFKEGTPKATIEQCIQQIQQQGASIGHRYESTLLGFSATFPSDTVLALAKGHPQVDFVEEDQPVHVLNK